MKSKVLVAAVLTSCLLSKATIRPVYAEVLVQTDLEQLAPIVSCDNDQQNENEINRLQTLVADLTAELDGLNRYMELLQEERRKFLRNAEDASFRTISGELQNLLAQLIRYQDLEIQTNEFIRQLEKELENLTEGTPEWKAKSALIEDKYKLVRAYGRICSETSREISKLMVFGRQYELEYDKFYRELACLNDEIWKTRPDIQSTTEKLEHARKELFDLLIQRNSTTQCQSSGPDLALSPAFVM